MIEEEEDVTNYYEVLGISKDASQEEIKMAYQQLVKLSHPDRSGSYSEKRIPQFHQIMEAYKILSDTQQRAEHDRNLLFKPHKITLPKDTIQKLFKSDPNLLRSLNFNISRRPITDEEPPSKRYRSCDDPPPLKDAKESNSAPFLYNRKEYSSKIDINGIEQALSARSPSSGTYSPIRDNSSKITLSTLKSLPSIDSLIKSNPNLAVLDIYTAVDVSFDESITGCRKEISFQRKETCKECDGLGNGDCTSCAGKNFVLTRAAITINIPPGVIDGCKKSLQGQGHASYENKRGDLIITVKVGSHPFFRRRGRLDVECNLPVSYASASLGVTLTVPSVRGPVQVCD